MPIDDRVLAALRNNMLWTDTVVRAHGGETAVTPDCWWNAKRSPRFYSNLIALAPDGRDGQRARIDALARAGLGPGWGVKDSFATLDLSAQGFDLLFAAQWLWRDADLAVAAADVIADFDWHPVRSAAALVDWERGFSAGAAAPPLFPAALARDPALQFLAAWRGSEAVCGATLNLHAGVCAIHNLFAPPQCRRAAISDIVRRADAFGGRAPLVHYTTAALAADWLALGFSPIGPLRVWLKR